MDWVRTPEQQHLTETVREFVARHVTPVAAELDRQPNPEDCFSWKIVEEASTLGIRTMTLAKEYGGANDPDTAWPACILR